MLEYLICNIGRGILSHLSEQVYNYSKNHTSYQENTIYPQMMQFLTIKMIKVNAKYSQ